MSENRKFQLNIKFGAGYEAPLLNIEGDNAQEFQANVEFAVQSVEALVNATTLFQAAYNVAKPQDNPAPAPAPAAPAQQGGPSWSQQGSQQAAPQAAPAPQAGGRMCVHGPRKRTVMKQGTADEYVAFFCTRPKGDPQQCKAEWGKPGE